MQWLVSGRRAGAPLGRSESRLWGVVATTARAMLLALPFILGGVQTAAAADFHVSAAAVDDSSLDCSIAAPCRTIQHAIDVAAASAGGPHRIEVAAGGYLTASVDLAISIPDNPNLQGLQLLGSFTNFQTDERGARSTGFMPQQTASPTTPDIDVRAANVTIDGFQFIFDGQFQPGGAREGGGIHVRAAGFTLNDNAIQVGSSSAPAAFDTYGLRTTPGAALGTLKITNNTFSADATNAAGAIGLNPGDASSVLIQGNTITGTRLGHAISADTISNVTITANTVSRSGQAVPKPLILVGPLSGGTNQTSIEISSNPLIDGGDLPDSIGIEIGTEGGGNLTISDVRLDGNHVEDTAIGIVLRTNVGIATVQRGGLTSNTVALQIDGPDTVHLGEVEFSDNLAAGTVSNVATLNFTTSDGPASDHVTLTSTQFQNSLGSPQQPITYANVGTLLINTNQLEDTVDIRGTLPGMEVKVNAGSGDDTINVGSESDSLDSIAGPLIISGQDDFAVAPATRRSSAARAGAAESDDDTLNVRDQGETTPNTYSITATNVVRTDGPTITYASIEHLAVNAGAAADTFDPIRASAETALTLHGGPPSAAPGDRLTYDAEQRSVVVGPGTITSPGVQVVNFANFETPSCGVVVCVVNNANTPPAATVDAYSTDAGIPLTVQAPGLLANDTDADSDPLTAQLDSGPSNGTLSLNADGSFTYTPGANPNGPDSFTYRANDGTDVSSPITVTITIIVNAPPTGLNDDYTTAEDTPLTVPALSGVLSNDSDPETNRALLTAVLGTNPAHGSLSLNADGSFSYAPAANFNGPDSFTYRPSDGSLDGNLVTVAVSVTAVADAPVATNDGFTVSQNGTLTRGAADGLLANDSDVDGQSLTAIKVSDPTHGTLSLNADGSFTYTPAANASEPATFTYKASDGSLESNVATVSLTVAAGPTISIADVAATEGDGGTTNAAFSVTLSAASNQSVTVRFTTASGTAEGGNDFAPIAPTTLSFAPGEVSKQVVVAVVGDEAAEHDESFFVDLSNPTNATIARARGVGTIQNDDQAVNDDFGDAAEISLPASPIAQTNIAATTQSGEPRATCNGSASITNTLWFRVTPTANRRISVAAESSFDTVVAVYTGGSVTNLARVACSDGSSTTFAAVGGTTYHIQVGGVDGSGDSEGEFVLRLSDAASHTCKPPKAPKVTAKQIKSPARTISFKAKAKAQKGCDKQVFVEFDFGDGTRSSSSSGTHTYPTTGSFTIQLRMVDSAGHAVTSAPKRLTIK